MTRRFPAVLRWVNEVRSEFGAPPVEELRPGWQGDDTQCPIARTITAETNLRASVDVDGAHVGTRLSETVKRWEPLPRPVLRFVRRFDSGAYAAFDAETKLPI